MRDDVAVIVPAVNVLMVAVIAFNIVVKKLVEVAFNAVRFVVLAVVAANKVVVPLVTVSLSTVKLVVEAVIAAKRVEVALVNDPLVAKRLVKYAESAESPPVVEALPRIYREATVVEERVEVASEVVPRTVSAPELVVEDRSDRNVVFCTQLTPSQ